MSPLKNTLNLTYLLSVLRELLVSTYIVCMYILEYSGRRSLDTNNLKIVMHRVPKTWILEVLESAWGEKNYLMIGVICVI